MDKMTLNDPLSNAMSTILSSEKVGRTECTIRPVSTMIKGVLDVLNEQRYIGTYTETDGKRGKTLVLNLIGKINICGVVKPRFSVQKNEYEKFEKRYLPARDMGILIVSTSKGLMTNSDAKAKGLGGKLIAYCY